MQLTDIDDVSRRTSRKFDCATCKENTQKERRCHEDRWDLGPEDGKAFPIAFNEGTRGLSFCPVKLYRDDPAFLIYCEQLFVAWKTGNLPCDGSTDTMDREFIGDLAFMIRYWESIESNNNFRKLGRMIGGDGSKG